MHLSRPSLLLAGLALLLSTGCGAGSATPTRQTASKPTVQSAAKSSTAATAKTPTQASSGSGSGCDLVPDPSTGLLYSPCDDVLVDPATGDTYLPEVIDADLRAADARAPQPARQGLRREGQLVKQYLQGQRTLDAGRREAADDFWKVASSLKQVRGLLQREEAWRKLAGRES